MENGFPSLTRCWPPDLPAWTLLGRAITVLATAKFGDKWNGKEHSSIRLRTPYESCSLPAVLDNCDEAQLKWIDRLVAHADEPLPPMPAHARTDGQKREFHHLCAVTLLDSY